MYHRFITCPSSPIQCWIPNDFRTTSFHINIELAKKKLDDLLSGISDRYYQCFCNVKEIAFHQLGPSLSGPSSQIINTMWVEFADSQGFSFKYSKFSFSSKEWHLIWYELVTNLCRFYVPLTFKQGLFLNYLTLTICNPSKWIKQYKSNFQRANKKRGAKILWHNLNLEGNVMRARIPTF